MAFLGSLGSALGLGTAQELTTSITGSPTLGRVAGATSRGISAIGSRLAQQEQGQAVAVPVAPPPAESAMSGERGPVGGILPSNVSYGGMYQPASFRGQAPRVPGGRAQQAGAVVPLVGGALTAGRAIGSMLGLAGGALLVAPTFIDPFTGEEKKLRVTRRLRSQVKKAVEMFGVEVVAEQMGVDVEVIFYILTKKMRNDGPYVTKAAVRKTRQTVRKMKHLCDMYDDLRPAAKRRTPARASTRTRVVNVK